MHSEFYSVETKDGKVLGVGTGKEGERAVDDLCLLTAFTQTKSKFSGIFRQFCKLEQGIHQCWAPTLPQGEIFLDFISKGGLPGT